jgi:hypothetical protein
MVCWWGRSKGGCGAFLLVTIARHERLLRVRNLPSRRRTAIGKTGITAYLEAGGTLENAQAMAAHESPRMTKLYDRTADVITLDEVERIVI